MHVRVTWPEWYRHRHRRERGAGRGEGGRGTAEEHVKHEQVCAANRKQGVGER